MDLNDLCTTPSNISANLPLADLVGLTRPQWLDTSACSFETGSGQPYAFQVQSAPADKTSENYPVFAPSGSGMTALLGDMAKAAGGRPAEAGAAIDEERKAEAPLPHPAPMPGLANRIRAAARPQPMEGP